MAARDAGGSPVGPSDGGSDSGSRGRRSLLRGHRHSADHCWADDLALAQGPARLRLHLPGPSGAHLQQGGAVWMGSWVDLGWRRGDDADRREDLPDAEARPANLGIAQGERRNGSRDQSQSLRVSPMVTLRFVAADGAGRWYRRQTKPGSGCRIPTSEPAVRTV